MSSAAQQKFRRVRKMSDDEDEDDDDGREAHEKDLIADEIFTGDGGIEDGEHVDVALHPGDDEEEDDEESGEMMECLTLGFFISTSCLFVPEVLMMFL